MYDEKILPQDIEAEKAVLGAILIDNEVLSTVVEVLDSNDFYRESHRIIFKTMLDLYENHKAIDLITVVDSLKKENQLETVDGIAYVTALSSAIATAANVKYHTQIVYEKAVLRKLIRVSTEIASNAYEGTEDIALQLDTAEKKILDISTKKTTAEYKMADSMLMGMVEHFQKLTENKGKAIGIPTGFYDLDKLTSGLQPADFIILAARPSMGKTAFSLNLVQNVALRAHQSKSLDKPYSVAFFSLEMSAEQLMHRMICSEAQIDSQRLRTGELSNDDWEKIWDACESFSRTIIAVDDTPGITAMEMRSKARKIKSEHGLDLIVVDYLQLMQGSGKKNPESRQQEVSEISRSLKALARELNVPLIALSQLSRSVESRQVKRPMLSDLRESGSLEQDADLVAFLYREDYYNPETENQNITELIVAKNRNGPVDTINLFFAKQFTRFESLSRKK